MHTADLFPAELAAAQAELTACHPHEPPCPPDSRCTLCYSADEISDAERFDEFYDDGEEVPEELWQPWQEIEAEAVCVSRYGAL